MATTNQIRIGPKAPPFAQQFAGRVAPATIGRWTRIRESIEYMEAERILTLAEADAAWRRLIKLMKAYKR
jgi:hypothetical protein